MNRIKNSLITFSALATLVTIIAAVTSGTTQGQSGPSSSKDVSVVNTPTVNLTEQSKVGIDPTQNTVKVDQSEREPVMIDLGGFQLVDAQANSHKTGTFLIPEGKRLVVEHVYGNAFAGASAPPEFLLRSVPAQASEFSLPLSHITHVVPTTGNPYVFSITQPVKFYVANPAGDGVARGVDIWGSDFGGGSRPVYLSGYLEPLP